MNGDSSGSEGVDGVEHFERDEGRALYAHMMSAYQARRCLDSTHHHLPAAASPCPCG